MDRFSAVRNVAFCAALCAVIFAGALVRQPIASAAARIYDAVVCSKKTACVLGNNKSTGPGVAGDSAGGVGVLGNSNGGGTSTGGVFGQTFNESATSKKVSYGVTGVDQSTDGGALNGGVFGLGNKGPGVVAVSNSTGILVQGNPAVILEPATGGTDLLFAFDSTFSTVAHLDTGGNLHLAGQIFTSGSCSSGCAITRTSSGKDVVAYNMRTSAPAIEDFGQSNLVGGRGYVAIDSAFAKTLDARAAYLVFLTPKGDNKGLYVTQESASGFAVRESQGGHSTLAFDYRIVAKPFDASAKRLPAFIPAPLSGPAQAARAALEFGRR
jgi:hypothetical protein